MKGIGDDMKSVSCIQFVSHADIIDRLADRCDFGVRGPIEGYEDVDLLVEVAAVLMPINRMMEGAEGYDGPFLIDLPACVNDGVLPCDPAVAVPAFSGAALVVRIG